MPRGRIAVRFGRDRWYTDSEGRHRPITPRKGMSLLVRTRGRETSLYSRVSSVLTWMLKRTPLVIKVRTAFVIADALYKNWDVITKRYETYKKEGFGTAIAQAALSSAQTEIAWAAISPIVECIPLKYRRYGKEILASFMNQITSYELDLARKFVEQRGSNERVVDGLHSKNDGQSGTMKPFTQKVKMPKEVKYA